jgi:hypothetical protein
MEALHTAQFFARPLDTRATLQFDVPQRHSLGRELARHRGGERAAESSDESAGK